MLESDLDKVKQFENVIKGYLIKEFGEYIPNDRVTLLYGRNYADEIICFYSKNDPYVKYEAEKEFADTIATKQIVIDDGGHLNSESGYTEFTELLKYI